MFFFQGYGCFIEFLLSLAGLNKSGIVEDVDPKNESAMLKKGRGQAKEDKNLTGE